MVPKSPAAAWPSHGASNGSAQKPPAFAWNWSLTNVGETAVAPAAARTPAAGRGCDTTPAVAAAGPPVAVMATIASRAAGPVRPARIRVRLVMLVFLPLLAQPGVRITPDLDWMSVFRPFRMAVVDGQVLPRAWLIPRSRAVVGDRSGRGSPPVVR